MKISILFLLTVWWWLCYVAETCSLFCSKWAVVFRLKVFYYQLIMIQWTGHTSCVVPLLTYLFPYLLHTAESFLEAKRFSGSQEIPNTLWTTRFITGLQVPTTRSFLSQIKPVHTPTPTSWRSILILFSHLGPGSLKWSLSLRFPHQNPLYASPVTHTRYMSRPSHSSRFYHPTNIEWGVQISKLLIM